MTVREEFKVLISRGRGSCSPRPIGNRHPRSAVCVTEQDWITHCSSPRVYLGSRPTRDASTHSVPLSTVRSGETTEETPDIDGLQSRISSRVRRREAYTDTPTAVVVSLPKMSTTLTRRV